MQFSSGNPVNASTGQLTVVAGCDYKAADGNGAAWVNIAGTWPNLAGATPYLVGYRGNQPIPSVPPQGFLTQTLAPNFPAPLLGPVAGSIVTPSGANQKVAVDLTALNTAVQPSPSALDTHSYALFAVLSNGDVIPLQTGPLLVLGAQS